MKQIITIQHTQSIHHTNGMVGSWTDWDLSELGIEQAERIGQKLAKQLSGHKIVMYASDLLRAKHTAEIVAKHMGITPNIRLRLHEPSDIMALSQQRGCRHGEITASA